MIPTPNNRTDLLRRIFELLDRARLEWCVLHGYETLPDLVRSDVDLIVRPEHMAAIPRILADAGVIVQSKQYEATAYSYLLLPLFGEDCSLLQVDVSSDIRRGGLIFQNAEVVLSGRRRHGDLLWIPAVDMEFICYLFRRIAKSSRDGIHSFRGPGSERLSILFRGAPNECMDQLSRYFSESDARLIARAASFNDWTPVARRVDRLRRALFVRETVRHPLRSGRGWLEEGWRRLRRALRPAGLSVGLLGPDGAGKSTVAAALARDLQTIFPGCDVRHLRYRIQRNGSVQPAVTDPHARPPRGPVSSLFKLAYWWLNYTLGYVFLGLPDLIRGRAVIFDRHYVDITVDPRRYRYGGPAWVPRLLARIIPTPDILFLLDAPGNVLQQRKREVELSEAIRQSEAYRELVRRLANGHILDASKPVAEVVSNARNLVLEHLALRAARRLMLAGNRFANKATL